jgi:hypothetical protein
LQSAEELDEEEEEEEEEEEVGGGRGGGRGGGGEEGGAPAAMEQVDAMDELAKQIEAGAWESGQGVEYISTKALDNKLVRALRASESTEGGGFDDDI